MTETLRQFGEQEPRPVWKDLIEIEKLIAAGMKRIDASGPDFLAKEEILKELRKRYNWYEKWASSTFEDRQTWAEESSGESDDYTHGYYLYRFIDLAEENYKTALGFFAPGKVDDTFNQVMNATIESSVEELEDIRALIGTINIEKVTEALLEYLLVFKKEVIYKDLTDSERLGLEEQAKEIESQILDENFLNKALPAFIEKLIETIRK